MKRGADTAMVTPTLVWPDFSAEDAETLGRRARRRLRRVPEERHAGHSSLELVARALDEPALPAAALVRLAQGADPSPDEYLAEPVMLRPDRDRLSLSRLGGDALDEQDAHALVHAAHEHFPAGELHIEIGEDSWYVRLPGQQARTGLPVEQAQEMLLSPSPEQFGVDVAGMRVLNELQMLWYSHPVNEVRRRHGRAEANALWVWGGGRLPGTVPRTAGLKAIVADEPVFAGLASWLGVPLQSPAVLPEQADLEGRLVVIPPGDVELGRQWLERFLQGRGGFRLLAAGRAWKISGRGLLWRW